MFACVLFRVHASLMLCACVCECVCCCVHACVSRVLRASHVCVCTYAAYLVSLHPCLVLYVRTCVHMYVRTCFCSCWHYLCLWAFLASLLSGQASATPSLLHCFALGCHGFVGTGCSGIPGHGRADLALPIQCRRCARWGRHIHSWPYASSGCALGCKRRSQGSASPSHHGAG